MDDKIRRRRGSSCAQSCSCVCATSRACATQPPCRCHCVKSGTSDHVVRINCAVHAPLQHAAIQYIYPAAIQRRATSRKSFRFPTIIPESCSSNCPCRACCGRPGPVVNAHKSRRQDLLSQQRHQREHVYQSENVAGPASFPLCAPLPSPVNRSPTLSSLRLSVHYPRAPGWSMPQAGRPTTTTRRRSSPCGRSPRSCAPTRRGSQSCREEEGEGGPRRSLKLPVRKAPGGARPLQCQRH